MPVQSRDASQIDQPVAWLAIKKIGTVANATSRAANPA
jgi:hypothetical protein